MGTSAPSRRTQTTRLVAASFDGYRSVPVRDSATSGIVSALLAGATPLDAAAIGNLAASITIQQLGTTGTASPTQLLNACGSLNDWSQGS